MTAFTYDPRLFVLCPNTTMNPGNLDLSTEGYDATHDSGNDRVP